MDMESTVLLALLSLAVVGTILMIFVPAKGRRGMTASIKADGVQEIEIVVKGRYRPDTVVVRKGVPARLLFNRQEDTPCSERVIFSEFRQERWLAPYATTAIEFTPTRKGDFLFTCARGMYQGRMLVEDSRH
ncbi:MAG TPA: cupredoxin domain-containing protein [Chloroflexota bacterium]|nr:cupredoxin domain-containing protein [Chloroflexota bacterium]